MFIRFHVEIINDQWKRTISPDTQSFGNQGQEKVKMPAAVSLDQTLRWALESVCVNSQPRPVDWEPGQDWESQPERLLLQVLSGPDSRLYPTPSSHHPASKLWN